MAGGVGQTGEPVLKEEHFQSKYIAEILNTYEQIEQIIEKEDREGINGQLTELDTESSKSTTPPVSTKKKMQKSPEPK